ncbi:MAG: hypothetical protein M1433_02535 [Candidatus Parvarchaeota archaeon]|nr:hypothetical protein [Candidatus Parvarchaeota archaeon]
MENSIITDRSLSTIDKSKDYKVRVVGTVESIDEGIGTFVLSDGGVKITCLPPVSPNEKPEKGEKVTVVGRVAQAGNDEVEIRTDHIERISEADYENYNKYLKQRRDLLSNGS